jgi:hypothetical protein
MVVNLSDLLVPAPSNMLFDDIAKNLSDCHPRVAGSHPGQTPGSITRRVALKCLDSGSRIKTCRERLRRNKDIAGFRFLPSSTKYILVKVQQKIFHLSRNVPRKKSSINSNY